MKLVKNMPYNVKTCCRFNSKQYVKAGFFLSHLRCVDAYLGLPQHLGKSSFSLVNDFQLLNNVIKDSILDAKKQQLRRITFNNNFRRIPCTCSFSRVQITIET